MNEQVKIFDNPEFSQIRTIEQENKVWFGATDVATALGYSNPRDAIVRHCKSAGVVIHDVGVQTGIKSDGSPSIQNITMKFINEGNVYRLIANSQLPQAEKFESWIFDDLVPKVMKEGGYIMENKEDTPEEIMARAVMIAQETIKRREQRIEMLEQEKTLLTETIKEAAPQGRVFRQGDVIQKLVHHHPDGAGVRSIRQDFKRYTGEDGRSIQAGWGVDTVRQAPG